MTWELYHKEFESVTGLPPERRYAYLIKKVADWEQIWGLGKDAEWASAGDEENNILMPVWPHERFAAACATGDWNGYEPREIALSAWLESWIPGMQRDQLLIDVFPVPTAGAMSVRATPVRFKMDLMAELTLYE